MTYFLKALPDFNIKNTEEEEEDFLFWKQVLEKNFKAQTKEVLEKELEIENQTAQKDFNASYLISWCFLLNQIVENKEHLILHEPVIDFQFFCLDTISLKL